MKYNTIPELIDARVKEYGSRLLFQQRDGWSWKQITWLDFDRSVKNVASYMLGQGFSVGDSAVFMSANRLESLETEVAVLHLGGVIIPVESVSDIEVLKSQDIGESVRFIIIDDLSALDSVIALSSEFPGLRSIVVFTGQRIEHQGVLNFKSVLKEGLLSRKKLTDELRERSQSVGPDTLAGVFYEAGESGPNTTELTHKQIVDSLLNVSGKLSFLTEEDQFYSYMSTASPYGKFINYLALFTTSRAAMAETPEDFVEDVLEVMPTLLFKTKKGMEQICVSLLSYTNGASSENKLVNILGRRIKYVLTDDLPAEDIVELFEEGGIKVIHITELNDPMD